MTWAMWDTLERESEKLLSIEYSITDYDNY